MSENKTPIKLHTLETLTKENLANRTLSLDEVKMFYNSTSVYVGNLKQINLAVFGLLSGGWKVATKVEDSCSPLILVKDSKCAVLVEEFDRIYYYREKTVEELESLLIDSFQAVWELNDPGHRIEHFRQVFMNGLKLMEVFGYREYDWIDVFTVSYFHDLFSWSRKNHHVLAAEYILTTDTHTPIIACLQKKRLKDIAAACSEHRASGDGGYSCYLSEVMAAADRGRPCLESYMGRAVQYRLHKGLSEEEALRGAATHIKEKYGRNGYAKYPPIYREFYKIELERLYKEIDLLTT